MAMEALWIACGCAFAFLPVLYLLWKHHPSYGANTGAPALPIVGSIPFLLLNKHRLLEWTCELFDRCPSLTRRIVFGRSVVLSTIDPAVVHHILKSHFLDYPKGPSFYPFFFELLGNGIFNCDGSLWRFQRKVASHVFTSNSLRAFVVAIADAEIAQRLLPAVDSARTDSDGTVDLQSLLMDYTFDTICQLTFGSDPGCLGSSIRKPGHGDGRLQAPTGPAHAIDDDNVSIHSSYRQVPDHIIQGFVQAFQVALQICAERFLVPSFVWKLKRALQIGSERRLTAALKMVDEFASFVIEQSKLDLASGMDRNDLLSKFMRLSRMDKEKIVADGANQEEGEGFHISDSLLKDILLCFMLAGRETVASGVAFAMWLLSIHPTVESKLIEEINGIFEARSANQVPKVSKVETFTYDEVKKMNYLQAVLSESMRLYPPVPFDCKYAERDDTFPDGGEVSKGNLVSFNIYAMGRAVRVWGKDCLEFQPERWLDEGGMFVPASPFKYPVFQAGPRVCLGKDFAFIQMKLLVASLVWNFKFEVQPGFEPKLSYGVTLIMVNGLPVTVKKRSQSV